MRFPLPAAAAAFLVLTLLPAASAQSDIRPHEVELVFERYWPHTLSKDATTTIHGVVRYQADWRAAMAAPEGVRIALSARDVTEWVDVTIEPPVLTVRPNPMRPEDVDVAVPFEVRFSMGQGFACEPARALIRAVAVSSPVETEARAEMVLAAPPPSCDPMSAYADDVRPVRAVPGATAGGGLLLVALVALLRRG